MAAETLILNPTAEGTGTQLDLSDGTNFRVMERSFPAPDPDPLFASNVDTEGELLVDSRYKNREISVKVRCYSEVQLGALAQVCGKLNAEGGTLKWTTKQSRPIVFDVLAVKMDPDLGHQFVYHDRAEVNLTFTAKPFGRGPEVQLSDHTETTLPHIVWTETAIDGDVPALGRLVIDDDSANDQWWLVWGIQSRYYDSGASAALFWQAESLTVMGTSAIVAGPTGASGSGSNVISETNLNTAHFAPILSTQASGGGAHMSHVGDFRVFARIQTPTANSGDVTLALEWAQGDFQDTTVNDPVTSQVSWEGTWRIVDLGQVHLTPVTSGTQRWEGRILARSTVYADDVAVDCLWLIPVTEGSGEIHAVGQAEMPATLLYTDGFHQTAGGLTTKLTDNGVTWTVLTSSDADDFAVDATNDLAYRSAVSDASTWRGRVVTAGTTNRTAIGAQGDFFVDTDVGGRLGLAVRIVDIDNYIFAGMDLSSTPKRLGLERVLGSSSHQILEHIERTSAWGTWWTFRIVIDVAGRYLFWAVPGGGGISAREPTLGEPNVVGYAAELATGGALATGKVGIADHYSGSVPSIREVRNFYAWTPVGDAAIYASRSVELRSDRVQRKNSDGTLYTPPAKYVGDYLKIPCAGRESRTVRIIAKASRNLPTSMADSGIDDISARLNVTPRFLTVPED